MSDIKQTVENSSFVIQIAGDNNTASIAVNINAMDGVPTTVQAAVLEKARRRLAEMPTDALPDHGPFAGLMPYLRNAQFVGREADLLALAARLKGGEHAAITPAAAATGMGGVGKTQLAVEFVHRYGQFFLGGAFWLSCADPQLIPSELARCGYEMQLPGYDALASDMPAQVRLVRRAFENAIPRLLVFDNCEDEALLRDYLPVTGGSRVLITSRRERWDATLPVSVQPIGVLSVAESVDLLRKLNSHLDDRHEADLAAIAREVDGLPLALHLAGSYLNQYRNSLTPADVLAELRRANALELRLLEGAFPSGELPTRHDKSVARTFALSASKLDVATPEGELAWQVLTCAACLAPGEPIPDELLKLCVLGYDADQNSLLELEDALQKLGDLGLAEVQSVFRMHRLICLYVRSAPIDYLEEAFNRAKQFVSLEVTKINANKSPRAMQPLLPHLIHISEQVIGRGGNFAGLALSNLGMHLHTVADYAGARSAFERAIEMDEAVHGSDHPRIAFYLSNLGQALQSLGDYSGARAAYERALKIDEVTFGAKSSIVARDLSNFGHLLLDIGDTTNARYALELALKIDEETLGEDDPSVARDLCTLGALLLNLGDNSGARLLIERALKIDEAAFGLNHYEVATDLNNLSAVLLALRDYAGAQQTIERAIKIDEDTFGPNHSDVARDVGNLGGLRLALGDYVGAKAAFERALKIDEDTLGSNHPTVAGDINNVGLVLQSMGDSAGAMDAFSKSYAILEKTLPQGHPSIRKVRGNLLELSASDGDEKLTKAIAAFLEAQNLEQAERVVQQMQTELFSERAKWLMQDAIDGAEDKHTRKALSTHLHVLQACKSRSIADVFAELKTLEPKQDSSLNDVGQLDLIVSNTRIVLYKEVDQRGEWYSQLIQFRNTLSLSAHGLFMFCGELIKLLEANGDPTGLGESLELPYDEAWRQVIDVTDGREYV